MSTGCLLMSRNCSVVCVLYGLSKSREDGHQVHPCCLHEKDFEFGCENAELLVPPSVIEETEEPVQIHVGRTFQEVLLQRVLEIVDSFIRILQKVILEDCPVHVSISCESAFEEWSSLGCFHRGDCHPVVHA